VRRAAGPRASSTACAMLRLSAMVNAATDVGVGGGGAAASGAAVVVDTAMVVSLASSSPSLQLPSALSAEMSAEGVPLFVSPSSSLSNSIVVVSASVAFVISPPLLPLGGDISRGFTLRLTTTL